MLLDTNALVAKCTLPGSLLVVALLSGCRPALIGKYRVLEVQGEAVLVPPPYWNYPANREIRTRLSIPTAAGHSHHTGCSAAVGPFGLSRVKTSFSEWTAKLPSLKHWQESMASGSFDQDFESFRNQIGKLAERGCFDQSARVLLDQAMRESIPVRINETYYYRYEYRLGTGFIDLVPGMQLKIERADFDPSGKFQGTHTLDYEIVRDSHRTIRYELEKTEKATDESAADRQFAAHQTGMLFERLFFLGKQVPPNLNYSAMVVGTRSPEHLEEIARTVKARPETGCPASADKENGMYLISRICFCDRGN